jgi:hypothetical protein
MVSDGDDDEDRLVVSESDEEEANKASFDVTMLSVAILLIPSRSKNLNSFMDASRAWCGEDVTSTRCPRTWVNPGLEQPRNQAQ